jgi:hypothetical protein
MKYLIDLEKDLHRYAENNTLTQDTYFLGRWRMTAYIVGLTYFTSVPDTCALLITGDGNV